MNFIARIYRRELRGKLRVWLSWIMLPLVLITIHQKPNYLGLAVLFVGAAIRFWGSACLDKEGKLSLLGPYRFSRNPLYLGSILIAAAIPISQDLWALAAFMVGASLLMHIPLIKAEEEVLRMKFGQEYAQYCQNVSRLFSPWLFVKELFLLVSGRSKNLLVYNSKLHKRNKGWEPVIVALSMAVITFLLSSLEIDKYFSRVNLPSALHFLLRPNS